MEFALVLPLMLLFATGITSLGHACIVRYQLANAAYAAARECTLLRTPSTDCAYNHAMQRLSDAKNACAGHDVTVTTAKLSLAGDVNVFEVKASCPFNGGAGLGYLNANNIKIGTITVTVQMPY